MDHVYRTVGTHVNNLLLVDSQSSLLRLPLEPFYEVVELGDNIHFYINVILKRQHMNFK